MEKLTIKAGETLERAQFGATSRGHSQVAPLHLLAALLDDRGTNGGGPGGGIITGLLEKAGANLGQIRSMVESELGRLPKLSGATLTADPKLNAVMQSALKLADGMKDQYVSTEHMLLALIEIER